MKSLIRLLWLIVITLVLLFLFNFFKTRIVIIKQKPYSEQIFPVMQSPAIKLKIALFNTAAHNAYIYKPINDIAHANGFDVDYYPIQRILDTPIKKMNLSQYNGIFFAITPEFLKKMAVSPVSKKVLILMKKLLIIFLLSLFFLFFTQSTLQAAPPAPRPRSGPSVFCTNSENINTALGCLPTDPQTFVNQFFKWALPLAGLVAFILIVFGAISHITSAGNPDKQQKAKEMISSAIAGLLVIIFSVVILQIIGKDVLDLPGLTR